MASKFGGAATTCVRCKKSVYFNEQATGPGGSYHKTCLVCKECNKRLDSMNLVDKDNEAYCKTCYGRLFGPKGYGYGGGAGTLSTESQVNSPPAVSAPESGSDNAAAENPSSGTLAGAKSAYESAISTTTATPNVVPRQASSSNRPGSGSKFGGGDGCPKCSKTVYFAEQVLGPGGIKYHKACFKCNDCNKPLDTGTVVDKDNVIYCKPCHGRKFGPKGYGYASGGAFLTTERAA